jgi:hypothetical protein
VSIRDRTPEAIADLILERLGLGKPGSPESQPDPAAPGAAAPTPLESAALMTWREKLAYFQEQEVIAVDPDSKFRLRKLIAEARDKIREHGGEP